MKALLLAAMLCPAVLFGQNKERIHIHTDKEFYFPGETIWMKSYISYQDGPSLISTNLFTALYNQEGKLIASKQFPLFTGSSNGDFYIPDSIEDQLLQLRAYTKSMFASDSTALYTKQLKILQRKEFPRQSYKNEDIIINFFPEGGTLVAGLINHVAIRTTVMNKPVAGKFAILETGSNKFIDSVSTGKDGIASFQIMPRYGVKYEAVWQGSDSNLLRTALPASIQNGVAMHIATNENRLFYSIQKNNDIPRFDKLKMSVLAGNEVVYSEKINLNKLQHIVNSFPTDSLSSGIVTITLTDNDNFELQRRRVFIQKMQSQPQIVSKIKNFQPKAKNEIEINIPDTFLYDLSVSIIDATYFDLSGESSIYDDILLPQVSNSTFGKNMLSGNPTAADLLLWTSDQTDVTPYKIADDNYLSIKVDYRSEKYGLPDNAKLSMILNDQVTGKQFLSLSQQGHTSFKGSGFVFYNTSKAYFQLNEHKQLTDKLSLSMPAVHFAKNIRPARYIDFSTSEKIVETEELAEYYGKPKNFNEVQTIKEVVVRSRYVNPETKRLQELDDIYASPSFRGLTRGFQLNVLDDPTAWAASDLLTYVAMKFPALRVVSSVGQSRLYAISRTSAAPVLLPVFVDETEMPDQIGLSGMSVSDVAFIKYIPGIVAGLSYRATDGVLFIYKRKGNEPLPPSPNMKIAMVKGYDMPAEFKIPDYSDTSSIRDNRSTLYWNPYLANDSKTRKVSIVYYNNDFSRKHMVVIRGITEEGTLVEVKKVIE